VAKTLKAHELLMVLNMQYNNGIRVDVSDPTRLGPFLSREESFNAIAALLDEAATHLASAGTRFPFLLPAGFTGFNTPATFRQFNRALAARVAVYAGRYAAVLPLLRESFLDLNGDYNNGVVPELLGGGRRPAQYPVPRPNATGDIRVAHPSWVAGRRPATSAFRRYCCAQRPPRRPILTVRTTCTCTRATWTPRP
jgi:hypothetical protein